MRLCLGHNLGYAVMSPYNSLILKLISLFFVVERLLCLAAAAKPTSETYSAAIKNIVPTLMEERIAKYLGPSIQVVLRSSLRHIPLVVLGGAGDLASHPYAPLSYPPDCDNARGDDCVVRKGEVEVSEA